MNLDQEDTTSLHGGTSEFGSEAAGAVSLAESTLTVPDETKNGVSHSSSESGLDVDRLSLGHGSGVSESERVFEPAEMVPLIKERVTLSGLKSEMWTAEHDATIIKFLKDYTHRLLIAYVDKLLGLQVALSIPPYAVEELTYMIRLENAVITPDNIELKLHFGTIKANHIESLLRMMTNVYAPLFFGNRSWPDSIKNDFSAQLHKFMANLTDTRYKMQGKTVLYVPNEGTRLSVEEAAKSKEFVQRLETAMIHWTRQIKEVLSSQDTFEAAENSGPLEEIEFWCSRCADLSGISEQLDKPGVRRIQSVLEQSKSSYVAPFLKLSKLIQDGSAQAQSNLKFLSTLKGPCEELAQAQPKEIPAMLAKILNIIRMIWINSEHYKSRERLTGLLRKVSNEIIRRCSTKISLDDIFVGRIKTSMEGLQESIECCESWKNTYSRISKMHSKLSSVKWVLDQSSIFAQVDAFVQRCKDLLEVCDGQIHFARMYDGEKTPLPCFHGVRGPEVVRSLLEVEATFEKNLQILKDVKKTILDVKATTWHDDYNRFRAGVKDLEVMVQNLICSAFETITTVQEGVEILDIFQHLSSREAIRRTIDKKTVEVYQLFNEELNLVKKEFNTKTVDLPPMYPRYAGSAAWARMLKRRIDRPMNVLKKSFFLPLIGTGEEIRSQYQQLAQALDEFVRKTFNEWTSTVDKEATKLLEIPLMRRSQDKSGTLDLNFDRTLVKLFNEIHYWEKLMFETPHYVSELYMKKEDLRILRENVLLVVRDYNRIIAVLSTEERGLFRERIRSLDKKIHPGLTKLTWASKGISDYFIGECRNNCSKVQDIVDDYKNANLTISKNCKKISEMLLIKIDGKRVYDNLEFEDEQKNHRSLVQTRLQVIHLEVVGVMKQTYEVFKHDGQEVQSHWLRYTEKIDRMVEEAFRLNVKWSLQELSRAINGDGKSAPNPLLRVKVVLEGDKVEFSPTLKKLASMMENIAVQLTACLSIFQRLPDLLTRKRSTKEPVYVIIERDDETKKIQASIKAGMSANASHLQSYLSNWDSYREIWEIQKDAFIRRYQRLNPPVSSFDADIHRYTEIANNFQKEETVLNIDFVLLDNSPLKFALLGHCNEWQSKFTTLLREMGSQKLKELHTFLKENAEKLSAPPETLDQLGESLTLLEQLQQDLPNIEAKFPPLHQQFAILEKYEVAIPEEHLLFFLS